MMRERDDVQRRPSRAPRSVPRARSASRLVAAGACDVHAMHRERHVPGGTFAFAERCPGIGAASTGRDGRARRTARIGRSGARRESASRSTIESRPPDSATATRRTLAPLRIASIAANASRTACSTGWTSAADESGMARGTIDRPARISRRGSPCTCRTTRILSSRVLEQRVERLILERAQRLGERLLERHHHRRVVAMRAAQGLVRSPCR